MGVAFFAEPVKYYAFAQYAPLIEDPSAKESGRGAQEPASDTTVTATVDVTPEGMDAVDTVEVPVDMPLSEAAIGEAEAPTTVEGIADRLVGNRWQRRG